MIRYDRPNANTSIEQFKRWVCARWPKQESKQFAIANGTFTSDSPDTNSVAWASCVVEYDSATYDIADGNTSDKYIYWDLATPTVFATSATIPSITENVIIVGTNTAGAFLPAWKAGQAAVVANSVSATALDGTTITGATVQTEATASRGIKLTSSSLKGYDGAGTETFSLTASDGSLSLTGAITTGIGSTISTGYLDGLVGLTNLNIANRGWVQTCAFSVTDADTVAWGVGVFTAADGTAYNINAGNAGNMAAKTYIYLNTAVSTTAYQTTTTATTAVGAGKVLIAIAQNGTGEASFMVMNGQGAKNIDASEIVAGSITANEIAASTITGGKIAASTITGGLIAASTITADKLSVSTLSAISADMGTVTAGTVTGATVQTEATASRGIKLTSSSLKGYDGAGTETFSLTASDGSFTLTGGIYRTDASGARVQIDATDGLRTITSGGVTRGRFAADGSAYIQSAASGARTKVGTSGIEAYSTDGQTVSIDTSGRYAIYSSLTGARIEHSSTYGTRGLDSSANVLSLIDKSTGKTTNKSAASGARMEYDQTNGIRVYDSSGNLVSQWGPSTGISLATAYSGARITIDPTNGIRGINSAAEVESQLIASSGLLKIKQIYSLDYTSKIDLRTEKTIFLDTNTSTFEGLKIYESSGDVYIASVAGSDRGSTPGNIVLQGGRVGSTYNKIKIVPSWTGTTIHVQVDENGTEIDGPFTSRDGVNVDSGSVYKVNGTQVVGAQGAAVADATGSADVVAQLNALLARCRAHGLIAT
jgi:hypothetical protein